MSAQVIETKRQPPLWKVKADKRIRAVFQGTNARSQAETHAREHFGEFTILAKEPTGKQIRRAEKLAEMANKGHTDSE